MIVEFAGIIDAVRGLFRLGGASRNTRVRDERLAKCDQTIPPRKMRAGVGFAAVCALAIPGMAQASTGCDALNSNVINYTGSFNNGAPSSVNAGKVDTGAMLESVRTNGSATDTANLDQIFAASNLAFATGDIIRFSLVVSGYGTGTLRAQIRRGASGAVTSIMTAPGRYDVLANGTTALSYAYAAGVEIVGLNLGAVGGFTGNVAVTSSCTPGQAAPTLSSFTYGSIAYNPGGGAATNIDVAAGGNATNSPTNYTVSNASGGTYGNTAATTGGGSVTINAAGVASYTPRVGYRGTDTFFAQASNGGGPSAPATVTVTVGPPTITASVTGSGAKVGTALSGYAVTPANGNAPYSCVLNSGSAALPAGITLNSNCTLTGTPTTPGTYSFNVDITDASVTGANGGTPQPYTQSNVAVTGFVIGQDAPTVTAVAPTAGSTAGGTSVVVTGTNFYNVSGVTFGGTAVAAGNIVVNSATQITVTSPARAAGVVNVVVTTSGGSSGASAANQYTYSIPPSVPAATAPSGTIGTTTPTYSGASDANVTITVYVDGASIGTTTANGSGVWSKAQPTALSVGSHSFYATATNAQGLVSGPSATQNFTVTTPPVLSAYAAGAVGYGSTGNSINVASGTAATGSPTSWQVSKDGISFATSAASANSGAVNVSISNAGVATYAAPTGFRGNDVFYVRAANGGGASNITTVTVPVNPPTLSATLTGSGTRGAPLSGVQITPTGGTAPYSCGTTLASGALPAGATLNADCSITGTPAATGTFSFTANLTDSSTPTFTQASGALTLTIAAPTLTLSPAAGALPGATAGAAYSQTITASGGTAPYSYAVTAGALPTGITLSAGGVLSGAPSVAGTFNFAVRATDSSSAGSGGPYAVTNSYSLSVAAPAIALSPATLPNGTIGVAYTPSVTATGGAAPYAYAVTAGALPTGVTLGSTGTFSGAPTAGGTFTFTVTATDSTTGPGAPYGGSRSYSVTIAAPTITLAPASLTAATIGTAYSATITASGGSAPYSYAVTAGALPAGVTLAAGGTLSGTPTAAGTFNFTVTATDASLGAGPYTGSRAYALTVNGPTIVVAPASLPNATAGVAYSQAITASGGTSGYSFAVTAGALPAGLALATDGTLSGTPTAGGSFTFTVTATDASGGTGPFSGSRAYTLTVAAATVVISPTTLPNGNAGTSYSQTLTATGGNGTYSFAVTAGALPPGWTLSTAGVLSGTATASNTFNFTITATDQSTGSGAPYSGSRAFTVNVGTPSFTLTPPTLTATVAQAYSGNFVAGGGTAPYTYTLSSGTLPTGLTLASSGTLSGTPTASGTFNFSVIARDSTTGSLAPYGIGRNFNFTISAPVLALAPATLPNGAAGAAYTATVSASGGTSPYSYAVSAGALPAGVSINATTGVLSGTPSAGGTFNFTVTATDSSAGSGPYTASRAYALTIAAATITLAPATLPNGTPGAAYSQVLTASGGTAPYGYAVSAGALPAGVTLSSTGTLSGTPTAAGTFNFTVTATDGSTGAGAPYTGARAYALTIAAPTIVVDPAALPNATVAAAYSQVLTASGGTAPYSFAVTAGALPAGIALATDGTLSGTPSAGGSFTFTVTATDSSGGSGPFSGSRVLTLVVGAPTIAIAPAALPDATVAAAYSQALTASGGTGGYSYAITAGALPAGVSLSPAGVLGGTPAAGGTFNFTVTATDGSTGSGPYTGSRTYALQVGAPALALAPAALPGAATGSSYTATVSASGGTAPYSYAVTAGALPAGLSLASDGTLSGTPSAGGTFNFTVTATDSSTGAGAPYSVSRAYALSVAAPTLALSPATLPGGQMGAGYSQSLSASGGTAPYSYAVTAGTLPAGLTLSPTGTISGTPSVNGTFNLTVTASDSSSGAGPYSVSRAYALVIAVPNAPVADPVSATVAYGSSNNPIAPALSGGAATSIAIATPPAHGTATVSGLSISYTPAAGYYGADSFTYTATNDGGTSAPATATVTVGNPPAPTVTDVSGQSVPYGSTGTAIDLSGAISGVHSGIAVATAPAHGTTSVSGDVVTYVPAAGYYGADSFTYTATGPGGTSATATVSLTVVTPGAPSAAAINGVAVAYNSAGTAIDVPPSVGGVYNSVAVASAPAHGTTSVSGSVITYVPTTGYYGADSFTYTATGPGGTSAPATVSVNVAVPAAPTASSISNVAVAYNSAGTAIDVAASVSGVYSSVAVASAPAHGTTSVSGRVITYVPATGYYGADSFTYTATGPGGTSAPATVGVNVALPPAPTAANVSNVAVAYNSAGTAIDLTSSISGIHTSVSIATSPAHGTVSVAGDVVTYVPTPGYYGTDSFTYTATGPGGTSAPATVSVNVAVPAAPTASSISNVAVAYNSTGTAIDVTTSVSGVYSSLAVASAPAHGTTSVSGSVITYVPATGFYGTDSFTYTATGPGGTSAPATVSVTVATPAAPTAAAISGVTVPYNSTGTAIDVTTSVSGVYSSVAVASAPAHGTTSVSGNVITYRPVAGYYGADSFTYTATGPGGTSAPATVSVSVAVPAAPTVANVSNVAVPYNSTGTAIDLTSSISGVHTSVSIATNPAHGTVSVAGDVVTYVPTTGYYGTDSFSYTATGPGGTSTPATVTLQVAVPAAPSVANVSNVAVQYNSAGTAIDLTSSITGVHNSVSVTTNPAHGTVTVAGDVVTYVQATGYYGTDSFTYTATGPGGTSTPATVTLQVAVPPPPTAANRSGVAIPYNGAGTPIELASDIAGVYTSVAIVTAPTRGTATITGTLVTYTPNAGYYGADSFTYAVTGPGGTSSPATVGLTIAPPPPPKADNGTNSVAGSTSTSGTQSVDIDLSALVTGDYTRIDIQTQPAHGAVTLRGNPAARSSGIGTLAGPRVIATYTPTLGFVGTDSFTFVAVGPGGTSAPGTVNIQVVGRVPVARPKTAQIGDGQTVSVMLTDGASEGPFTAATIVSVTPADKVTATIVASGSGAAQAYRLDVSPAARFGGTVVVTYTLSNAYGRSAPSTVTVTVTARPDPTTDPNVRAISDAQAETTRRFARAQVGNFMRRTEQLHGGGSGTGGVDSNVSLNSRDGRGIVQASPAFDASALAITERMRPSSEDPALGRLAASREGLRWNRADQLGSATSITEMTATERQAARKAAGVAGAVQPLAQDDEQGGDGARRNGSIGVWSGGAIDIGTQDATTDRSKITATSAGLSAGADVKLAEGVTIGIGGGYGNDLSRIDGGAARVRSDSTMVAFYASVTPLENAFVDGMIGRGDLSFRTRRLVPDTNATAIGSRDGSFTVAALALGIDRQSDVFSWSLYGRGEALDATLGAYVETGADRFNLRFDERKLTSVTGTLGARFELKQKYAFGTVMPRVRAEWSHEFADADAQRLDYADIPGSALYGIETQGWSREQFQLSLGSRFLLPNLWSFDFETSFRGSSGQRSGSLRAQVTKEF